MRSLLQKIISILLLLTCLITRAQVKFSATVTPGQISKDGYTQLKFIVENAGEVQNIDPPALKNFVIISGPNQESGMSVVNGAVTKYIAVSYVIRPKGSGTFVIPPVVARADGSLCRSNPVSVKVSNTLSGNNSSAGNNSLFPFNRADPFGEPVRQSNYQDYILQKGENAADKVKKNLVVKVETDKPYCYVGEPVIATYKLYTRLKSESSMTKNPSFNGFSVIDLQQPDNENYRIEKLNGRVYNVYTIRKAQLYPLQSGSLELEPAEVDNKVHFVKAAFAIRQQDIMGDLFGDLADAVIPAEGIEEHRISLQSEPLSILVKPLPENSKPVNFKGAVGNFSLDAYLSKDKFTTDDACECSLIIGGSGNLQLVTAPVIDWPGGIDGFEPKITDELNKLTVPVSGRKIISYPFTAARPGNYIIPAIAFSYFDLKTSQYRTIATKPLAFTVVKGTGKQKEKGIEIKSANDYK